jgi:DNA primase
VSEKISQYVIENIRSTNKIVNFLSSEGINYEYQYKGKYMYVCPFPDHNDNNPSLAVYDSGEYDNFYCFGCKRSGDVVSLNAQLKNIPWHQSVKFFGGDLDINKNDELNFIIGKIRKESEEESMKNASDMMYDISLEVSLLGYNYLERVEFDDEEAIFLDKLYQEIDKLILSENIDSLCKIYEFILDGDESIGQSPFILRYAMWEKRCMEKTADLV